MFKFFLVNTKSTILIFISVIAIVILNGCSSKYTVSAKINPAYIKVVNSSGEPDKDAFISTYEEAESCKKRLWLQQGVYIPGDITTSYEVVEASKAISISIYGSMGSSCVSTFSFVPEQGRYYRAIKSGCNTVTLESSSKNDFLEKRNETVRMMEFNKAFTESGSWCKPSALNEFRN